MHSEQLAQALIDFAEDAASALRQELAAGAEIPFELASTSGRRHGAGLFVYRSLTESFVRERWRWLERLESHEPAVRALEACHGLERYIASHGGVTGSNAGAPSSHAGVPGSRGQGSRPPASALGGPARARAAASAALHAFTEGLFHEQSDFELHRERFDAALRELDAASEAQGACLNIIATLHGVAIVSPELLLAPGLTIAQLETISDLPEQVRADAGGADPDAQHLVVLYSGGEDEDAPGAALARGKGALRDLLTALRLFGDGRVALGPIAWARVATSPFAPIALASPARRPKRSLLVTPEQEDELRAFCSLVAKRIPAHYAIAWALRRFERGCSCVDPYDGLSDHLLALQALLDPDRRSPGLLASRVAALCASAEKRQHVLERVIAAVELERETAAGEATAHARGFELAHELASWLKALLSDVICGHLERNLDTLADELLLAEASPPSETAPEEARADAVAEGAGHANEDETIEVRTLRTSRRPAAAPAPPLDDPLESLDQGILPL